MIPSHATPALAAMCAAALLAGCGTAFTVYEGRYAISDGWRRATVAHTVGDAELPAALRPPCPALPAAGQSPRWVIVDYRPNGSPRRAAVPAGDGAPLAAGTPVYVRVQDCLRELAPRGGDR